MKTGTIILLIVFLFIGLPVIIFAIIAIAQIMKSKGTGYTGQQQYIEPTQYKQTQDYYNLQNQQYMNQALSYVNQDEQNFYENPAFWASTLQTDIGQDVLGTALGGVDTILGSVFSGFGLF